METDQFKDRYICLVLCCNRDFYNDRKQKNDVTFEIIKNCNFVIVNLYADNSQDSITVTKIAENTYNMIVPAPEMYELISYKMNIAYSYFSKIPIKGILKIDDNTQIAYPEIIEHDFIDILSKYDYIGLEKVVLSHETNKFIFLKNRTNVPLLENIYHKLDIDMTYFGGPFYYLSPRAIQQVVKTGLKFGYEDVSVGYAVSKDKTLKQFLWNFKNKGVSWDNAKEVDPDKKSTLRKN